MNEKGPPKRKMITPRSRRFLLLERRTISDAFHEAGYTTAFMGKWHLGHAPYLPGNHGFDVVVGGRHHSGPPGGYFAPWPINTIPEKPQGTHIDDTITGEVLKFIERNRDEPFFLNLWFYSVHAPFQAKKQLIEKYSERTDPRGEQSSPTMARIFMCSIQNMCGLLTFAQHDLHTRRSISQRTFFFLPEDVVFWHLSGTVVQFFHYIGSKRGEVRIHQTLNRQVRIHHSRHEIHSDNQFRCLIRLV